MEGAAIAFTVNCYTDTSEPWVLVAPTTLRYRVENPETGAEIVGWTTVSPASSATITVTGAQNTLSGCETEERRALIVEADHGLSSCDVAMRNWWIRNLAGVA
jgi:hypothetical protein